jgi:hypothetical protein
MITIKEPIRLAATIVGALTFIICGNWPLAFVFLGGVTVGSFGIDKD